MLCVIKHSRSALPVAWVPPKNPISSRHTPSSARFKKAGAEPLSAASFYPFAFRQDQVERFWRLREILIRGFVDGNAVVWEGTAFLDQGGDSLILNLLNQAGGAPLQGLSGAAIVNKRLQRAVGIVSFRTAVLQGRQFLPLLSEKTSPWLNLLFRAIPVPFSKYRLGKGVLAVTALALIAAAIGLYKSPWTAVSLPPNDWTKDRIVLEDADFRAAGPSGDGKWLVTVKTRAVTAIDTGSHESASHREFACGFDCGSLSALAVNSDGSAVWVIRQGRIELWQLTGKMVNPRVLATGTSDMKSVAISPKGQLVAAADETGRVWLLDSTSGKPVQFENTDTLLATAVAFPPLEDNRLAVAYSKPARVVLYDLSGASAPRVFSVSVDDPGAFSPNILALDPGAKWIAAGGEGRVWLWSRSSSDKDPPPSSFTVKGSLRALTFNTDGTLLCISPQGARPVIWDMGLNCDAAKRCGVPAPETFEAAFFGANGISAVTAQ